MNDWDNLDNFPTDDDDNDEFDWLDDDESAGDDDDLSWLSDADDELDEDDKPQEWQMPRSNRAERDIASQIEDAEDADFGNTEEGLDWMAEADSQDEDTGWGLSLDDEDTGEADDDTWLVASTTSDDDEDVDSFLFDTSPLSDEDDDADSFLFDTSPLSEDDDDDLLLGVSSDEDPESDWGLTTNDNDEDSLFESSASEDTDAGWGISLDGDGEDDDDDADSFLFDTSPLEEDDDEDLDSILFDTSPLSDDTDNFGEWGDLDDSDMSVFDLDDASSDLTSEQDDIGVPDWLSDMPLPDETGPATSQDVPSASDDIGVPDWLADAEDAEIDEPLRDDIEDDELDFMRDLDAPLPESDIDDIGVPDWLADAEDAETEEPIAEVEGDDLADLLGEDVSDDEDDLSDLLDSLDTDDDTNLDDLLASLDVEEENVELDDLFASLDMSSEEADADLDDLLLEPDAELEADDFDFSEPVAESEDLDDLDFLEPVADANDLDDLDFLEPVPDINESEEMDFLEAVSTDESFAAIEADDESVLASEVDALDEAPLDFLDEDESDEAIASAIDDEEFAAMNQLNVMNTREMDDVEADFFQEDAEADFDFFDNLEDSEDIQEWFEEEKRKKPTTGSLSFLDNIPESADDPDWLDEISGIDTDTLQEAAEKSKQTGSVDIDALIDSFGEDESADNEILPAADLDAILDSMDEETRSQLPDDLPAEALPEWLQEIAKGTDAASAAALIRQRSDRSLDDLDDRLLELRERGLELSSTTSDTPESQERLSKIVPNIDEALTPAQTDFGQAGLMTAPTISPEQAQRATLLEGLVGSSLGTTTTSEAQSSTQWLRAITSRADRIIISLLLIAGVFVPFVYSGFDGIGTLPPSEFSQDSDELAAFTLIEDLTPSQYVLVAAEYGATGARELDTATRSFLEHIISNGAIPVIVSSDAVGLLRAENIAVELLGEESRNQAYYIAGFLPGGNIGLRDFASNLNSIIRSDVQGNATGLTLISVDEFSAIILISESGETVRNWMEQVAPLTDTSIIVMSGQAARPLALPYTSSSDNVVALLTGYDDAYTYQQMALGLYNPSATPSPIASDTATATDTPLPTATDLPTDTPTATATASDTPTPSETPLSSDTPIPSLTPLPETETSEAEEPATDTPTDTPMPTEEEETATADLIEVAVVNSESPANVRAGSGSDFAVINTIEPGEALFIIERSADEDWVRVILPDNSTGWIASILLTISEIPEDEFEGETTFDDNIQIGTVVADSRVNVRAGAGSGFGAVAGLDPNTQVRIIGISEDGEWYNIVLPNGGEGWIASFLMEVEEIPEDEWEGASKDGFFPIYYDGPIQIQQGDDGDTLVVGRNAAGVTMPIFADADQSEILRELPNGAEFIVIEEGEPLTQILMEDGQIGFIETRVIVTEERARSEVDFAPTPTLTPTLAPPTATSTATPTFTPSPFAPQITPAPLTDPTARTSSQSFGLVIAIAVIALGNLFWIFRWLGQREQ